MKSDIKNKYKKFIDLLNFSNGRYKIVDVFKDFVTIYAIAIKNKFHYKQEDEDIYFETIKKYRKSELDIFPKLIEELEYLYIKEREIRDVLGEIYYQIGAINKQRNQFFSPKEIGKISASVLIEHLIKQKNLFMEINDFACGSGALLLYYADELINKGIDYITKAFYWGQDSDFICFCMTYIQMSLYGMPGFVIWGNTLHLQEIKVFYTPQYYIGKWEQTIKTKRMCKILDQMIKDEKGGNQK